MYETWCLSRGEIHCGLRLEMEKSKKSKNEGYKYKQESIEWYSYWKPPHIHEQMT